MYYRIIISCLLSIVFPCLLSAQDFDKDMSVFSKFVSTDQTGVEMTIQLFQDTSGKSLLYVQKMTYLKDGERYYYQADGIEHIIRDGYLVIVKPKEKKISCVPISRKEDIEKIFSLNSQWDSLMKEKKKNTTISYEGYAGAYKKYRLLMKNSQITRADFYISDENIRIDYFYDAKQVGFAGKSSVVYKEKIMEKSHKDLFDIEKYLYLKRERTTLRKAYAHYKLELGDWNASDHVVNPRP